jgi:ubiquinone/menaquinone biosynthesis C-methylase UbiE
MASSFTVHDAAGYEQLMGRWSRALAPSFIEFAGIAAGEEILDVGCGTGSLTFELATHAELAGITAIDFAPAFVEAATRRNTDQLKIQQADAMALPFADASFDRAMALLVLHFVPDAPLAIREMQRVVRPGGVVAAVVWDHLGGMPGMRMIVDTLAMLSEAGRQLRNRYVFQPMMQELTMRMSYAGFDDLWGPIAAGEGPIGKFVGTLAPAELDRAAAAVRDAYEGGRPDGPRSFANHAWACRGIVA